MKTSSLDFAPGARTLSFRFATVLLLRCIGATMAYVLSMTVMNLLSPMPKFILDKTPPAGILSLPGALLFNGVINAVILVWVGRRSSFKGLALWGQIFTLSFGVVTFQTQLETGYFISAFPLLQGNFEVYHLILRGLIASGLFATLLTWIVGGFGRAARGPATFAVRADWAIKQSLWLPVVYLILYMLFGYYVAWQSQGLRLFYGGPAQLNSAVDQWLVTFMVRPELPVFQYFRGVLWILCLVPLFKGFSGKRVELVVLSALALGLLPTAALAFPNPLMPAEVSLYHFWEVSISTGIFGALCAWFIPASVAGSYAQ